jgi:serine/threonine-protein kinase
MFASGLIRDARGDGHGVTTTELLEQLQQTLGDLYVIERELSPGGMSRLFLATESSLGRKVVIKMLPPETASEVSAARFQREVHLAAQLQHPNILPVLSTGTSGDGFYYVMPFVAGESLRHRLESGDRFPIHEALRVLREIADALALAHSRGIVHRDIKPANILLQEGHAVLTDFGIARAVEEARLETTAERLTATGIGIGTLGYMAPEQLAGEKGLDARADVYALAVVGYEMLAGKPPFSRPTMQALVAAHMSEPPPPLSEVAPDVPPVISVIIEKALAKLPDDRYRTAAEFRDALDLQMTAAFQVVPRKPKVPRWAIVGGATAAGLAIAAAAYFATRPPKLDPNYVVVLPFNVQGADPKLSQGMVDMLQPIAAGWVKTVAPTRYLRSWRASSHADEASAADLGRKMGAGLAIYGTAASLPHDSLSLTATVYNVIGGKKVGVTHQRNGRADEVQHIANDLLKDLRGELSALKPLAAFRSTWLEETTAPALEAFLIGEQFYRRSAWDSAAAYYRRAIESDSALALASRHAGLAFGWLRGTSDSLARAYLAAAGRHNTGLPPRDSILVAADAMRASLAAFETDTSYYATVVQLFKTLRAARDSFPTDPEVWFALGDAYFHYGFGPGLSVSEDTIRAAFDRSIALDSGFTPAYIHAIELSITRDGRDAGLKYADRYLALQPTDEEADGIRVLTLLLRDGGINAKTSRILDTLSDDAVQTAWLIVRRWPDTTEIGTRLLQLPNRTRASSSAFIYNPGYRRLYVVDELALRGRLREAFDTLGTNIGSLEAEPFAILALFGAIPSDTANAVFARMLHDRSVWVAAALPWWAAHGDTMSLLGAAARADSQLARAATPVARRNAGYRVAATLAYLSLARHSTDALTRFRALPDSLCPACYLDRYTKARLLDSLGLHVEAETALGERLYSLLAPLEVPWALERALVAEKLQHYPAASRAYALVARAWSGGDGPQRAVAMQAATKAGQLGGDQPLPVRVGNSDR